MCHGRYIEGMDGMLSGPAGTPVLWEGSHYERSGRACFVEAWTVAHGHPFSDEPDAIRPAVSRFMRIWNDAFDDLPDRPDPERTVMLGRHLNAPFLATSPGFEFTLLVWLFRDVAPTILKAAGQFWAAEDFLALSGRELNQAKAGGLIATTTSSLRRSSGFRPDADVDRLHRVGIGAALKVLRTSSISNEFAQALWEMFGAAASVAGEAGGDPERVTGRPWADLTKAAHRLMRDVAW